MGGKKRTKWSRKRKQAEKERKAGAQGKWEAKRGDARGREYKTMIQSNAKMEAYYTLQGLHNTRLSDDGTSFVPCVTDEDKEAERQKWITCLKTILPASFRLGTDLGEELRGKLETELDEFTGKEIEIEVEVDTEQRRGWIDPDAASLLDAKMSTGETADATPKTRTKKVSPASRIEYIPHGYQLSVDRRTVKRNEGLAGLHDWLKIQTAAGFLTRQETVSMIPPVVLSPEPGDSILDMCAAPGSKTSQLLEVVSKMPEDANAFEPAGYVVANDADPKRAYMLVNQLRRINAPNVFVTSIEGQVFPNLLKGEMTKGEEGMFDRVLCDVPCSGDGTTRKNPGMWKTWTQLGALSLHPLQLRIALNGCRLTKVGGYMCYSTCSMNPVENEAVVAEILREADGAVELVEKRDDMPGLRARPGWTSWKVLREDRSSSQSRKERENHKKKNNSKMQQRKKEWEHKNKQETNEGATGKSEGAANDVPDAEIANASGASLNDTADKTNSNDGASEAGKPASRTFQAPKSWDENSLLEVAKSAGLCLHEDFESVPEEWKRRVRKSVFPPSQEEITSMNLDRCMRCLPHDMNTGGFFVALFKKVAPMRSRLRKADEDEDKEDEMKGDAQGPEVKRRKIEDNDAPCESTSADGSDAGNNKTESSNSNDGENDGKMEGKQYRGAGRNRNWDNGNADFKAPDADKFPPLIKYYGLSDTFPQKQIMVRSNGDAKVMYFIGRGIKESLIDKGLQDKVTVINSGLKSFERNSRKECEVDYRVTQEGIHFIAPHMTKRVVPAEPEDFARCIGPGGIQLSLFSEEFAKSVRSLSTGSFVVALKGYECNVGAKMFLVMWRCRGDALNCLVNRSEQDGMFSKLRGLGINIPEPEPAGEGDVAKKDEKISARMDEEENAERS